MQYKSRFFRQAVGSVLAVCTIASAGVLPLRLDLFDASDNNLMFITFEYEAGVNIGRTVYMSDSTFIRRVAINRAGDGSRTNEVSYNFNNDTSYVMSYQAGTGATQFRLVDQFKVDQVGGMVSSSSTDGASYDLKFMKTGTTAAKMIYEKGADGSLIKVSVYDNAQALQYYGKFTNGEVGVTQPRAKDVRAGAQVSVKPQGSQIALQLNLPASGAVRCELITLSGRSAGVLLDEVVKAGRHTKRLGFDGREVRRVAGGVYLLSVSIDGVTVSRSRYLHQNSVTGGGR